MVSNKALLSVADDPLQQFLSGQLSERTRRAYHADIQHFFSFIGKYLLLSTEGREIVDFLIPNTKYKLLADNVPRVSIATGGLLQNLPINVCGGFHISQQLK